MSGFFSIYFAFARVKKIVRYIEASLYRGTFVISRLHCTFLKTPSAKCLK